MASADQYQSNLIEVSVAIAASASTSAAGLLYGTTPIGLAMPTPFTGTVCSFLAGDAADTYRAIYKTDGNQLTVVTAGDRYIPLDPELFKGVNKLKIVSNAVESAIRNITIMGVPKP